MGAGVIRIQVHGCVKMLPGLLHRFFLIPQNTEVEVRPFKIRLQLQRFGKFRCRVGRIGFLDHHRPQIIVQVGPLRFEFNSAVELGTRPFQVARQIQHARKDVMRFGIGWC